MCYTYKFDHVFSITMNTYRSMKSITRANQNIGADDDDQFIHDDILEACQTTTQEQNAVGQVQEAGSPRQSARTWREYGGRDGGREAWQKDRISKGPESEVGKDAMINLGSNCQISHN